MIALANVETDGAKIRVVGIGGGGGNAVNNMITRGLSGVDFIAANTDRQALEHNLSQIKIQIGKETTRGLGAGANPDIGRKSVEECNDAIRESLEGSDMIFITAGMGGGTGTGAAPIIAKIGQELGALVVSIVTKPFIWEGRKRILIADDGILELRKYVDALIVIPNQRLLEIIDKNTSFNEAFQKVDEVLYNATRGISDIISVHGVVNVDFADVKTIMKGMGDALMGIGIASGENRAAKATEMALNSPLLDGISITGSKGVLVNITGGSDMSMHEIAEAVSIVEKAAGGDVNLIHGVVHNPEAGDELSVTVVATGFTEEEFETVEVGEEQKLFKDKVVEQEKQPYTPAFPAGAFKPLNTTPSYAEGKDYLSSPKGPNQLKKYDRPAYERKTNGNALGDQGVARAEKLKEYSKSNAFQKELEKPAFLRKIMD